MGAIGSSAWIARLDDAVAELAVDPELEGFVLHQIVTGDGGTASWTLAVRDGRLTVSEGQVGAPDVTLRTDEATAHAVQHGELGAQEAFMAGRLTIGGDPTALVRAAAHIGDLAAFGGPGRG